MLRSVASSPELRGAIAKQSAGLAEEVIAGLRSSAVRLDARLGRSRSRRNAGVATRGAALALDALLALGIFVTGSAVVALIASLVGGIRPHWLAGSLLGAAWVLVAGGYFVLFWSTTGQTPGMRLLRVRVRHRGAVPSVGRSIVRMVGLVLAIVPVFLGFVPVLFDERRRGLPDFLAGTVVKYEDEQV